MSADGVVEHFDVAKDCAACLRPAGIRLFSDSFALEQLEEAFRHCVVMAVASPAHAGLQVMAEHKALPFMAGELAALVGVHDDCLARPSAPDGHVQRIQSQLRVNTTGQSGLAKRKPICACFDGKSLPCNSVHQSLSQKVRKKKPANAGFFVCKC